MNTRQKMYQTNGMIMKKLKAHGYKELYQFPHLRFCKDWNFGGMEFDTIGWIGDDKANEFCCFQFKTNCKATKKKKEIMKQINQIYGCKTYWVNRIKGKIFMYSAENDAEFEL